MPGVRPKDKYYKLAKEQGYRSRAAFKLLQIHEKFGVLNGVHFAVDLCAAPGSWLQVLERNCPNLRTAVGIDLDKVKPVPKSATAVFDITGRAFDTFIAQQLRGKKADLLLCDGAPNVRGEYFSDATGQNQLVFAALQICLRFLRPKGVFVTKFYRSQFSDRFLQLFRRTFAQVSCFKPKASRPESAEEYIVCREMRAAAELLADTGFVASLDKTVIFQTDDPRTNLSVEAVCEPLSAAADKVVSGDDPAALLRKEKKAWKTIAALFGSGKKALKTFRSPLQDFYSPTVIAGQAYYTVNGRSVRHRRQVALEDYLCGRVETEALLFCETIELGVVSATEFVAKFPALVKFVARFAEIKYICECAQQLGKSEAQLLQKMKECYLGALVRDQKASKASSSLPQPKSQKTDFVPKTGANTFGWTSVCKQKTRLAEQRAASWSNKVALATGDLVNSSSVNETCPSSVPDVERIPDETEEREETAEDFTRAQTLALARKAASAEGRTELADSVFSKRFFVEETLPTWFVNDETRANDRSAAVDDRALQNELFALKTLRKNKLEKKETEAKARALKKKKEKIEKLNVMLEKDADNTKKEVKKLVHQLKAKRTRGKVYAVAKGKTPARNLKNNKRNASGRNDKVVRVDARLKKDKRNLKSKQHRFNKVKPKKEKTLAKHKRR